MGFLLYPHSNKLQKLRFLGPKVNILICFVGAMEQQVQGRFSYHKAQLINTEPLGTGSYGAVYKATCDNLLCAGKILHPTFFQFNDPGATIIMRRFQQECSFLGAIRHPNIVQYLGSYQDPGTQLPVLLMELMDQSLTRFLEQSKEPLPYHIQLNICHDVAVALAYLHSNSIIHRDLSSNNVLLIGAGNRAKVTDFGMAKLFDVNHTTMTPLTKCPGTLVYMSPEALDEPPVYTKKLDTFSFGVLDIQIITRQFPEPGPSMKKVQDPRYPMGTVQVAIPDAERRKSHIDLINPAHPLLPIAIDCLNYSEKDRPSAQELCHCLAALKKAPQYGDSVQQAKERNRPDQSATELANGEDKERQIRELQQEKTKLLQQLEECDQQIQQLRQEGERVTREKDRAIEASESQLQIWKQKLASSEVQFQIDLQQKEKTIQELRKENQYLRKQLQNMDKQKLALRWETYNEAPRKMFRGSAAVFGSMAYFRPRDSKDVHSYNLDAEKWRTLPECPKYNFTLAVVNGLVTAVGGSQFTLRVMENLTNTLLSLMEEGGRKKWVQRFPPMPTQRKYTAVVSNEKALVVAGGKGEGEGYMYIVLSTVEVMDTDTLQWSTASSLPHPLTDATITVCGDRAYLVGGDDGRGLINYTKSVFTCSLSALLQSQTRMKTSLLPENHPIWHTITDLPVNSSSCVTLKGQLLAVGGHDPHTGVTNNIYSYDTGAKSWEVISHISTPQRLCLATVLHDNKLMVFGGRHHNVDKVEIATV